MTIRPLAIVPARSVVLAVVAGCAVAALTGCAAVTRDPSGTPATEIRALPEFTKVELKGVGDVTVFDGGGYGVTVSADSAYIDDIVTKVVNGTLVLDEDFDYSVRNLNVDFIVTVPSIEAVTLTGAGNFTVEDVDTDAFEVHMVGAGNVVVSGTASTARLRLTGAGNIDTLGLEADTVEVDLTGAGDVSVRAKATLDVTLAGVGNVSYVGDPRVTSKVTGIGSVQAH